MSNKNSNSIIAHFKDLLVSEGTLKQYVATVLIVTVLGIILAVYIQTPRIQIPAITVYPIVLPIVASYWLAAYLPDYHFYWMIIFVVISLAIHSLLFLPVLMRTKFKARFTFISIQISILVAYILITNRIYQIFISWMSV